MDVDAAARCGWTAIDVANAFLAGGARFIQLRAKTMSSGAFLDLATAAVESARSAGATVIVNDRADIARLARAHGVHVGQEDLAPRDVRTITGPGVIVGLSTHTSEQMSAALLEPVDYVAIGPVFGTRTKSTGYDAIGLDRVRSAAGLASAAGKPLVAIGGIALETAASVIAAGASSVAVIGDLLKTGDPERRVREYLQALAETPL